jgi:hypothetical protein
MSSSKNKKNMGKLYAFVVALLFSSVLSQSVFFSTYTKPATNKYCRRNLVVTKGIGSINAVSSLGCLSVTNSTAAALQGRYGVLGFQLSNLILPSFGTYGFGFGGNGGSDSITAKAYLWGARFMVDSLVEYVDTNGVAGYQPSQVRTTFLQSHMH